MTVAELISELQQFDPSTEVMLELTIDYRDRCFPISEDDIYYDEFEEAVIINSSTLSA